MVKNYKKDTRSKFWAKLELEIQKRGNKKDKTFVLSGKWKRFVRKQEGFKIYSVDVYWVKNNISVIFDHGGHGYVHEFIPKDEIWVSTNHFDGCNCKNIVRDQKVSKNYFDSTVIHEITEFKEMKKGKGYWESHQIALQKELDIGLLKDPYTEIDSRNKTGLEERHSTK